MDKEFLPSEFFNHEYMTGGFRNDFAKSARILADKGHVEKALEMYELAIEDDPLNSALHDKFSWFLLNRTQQFEYTKKLSLKAVELNNNNQDATVGLSLVYYRLGDIENGDTYIDKAYKLGRTLSFSLLRKGIARYHKAKKQNIFINRKSLDDKESLINHIKLLDDALSFLQTSEVKNNRACGYDWKNLDDIHHYLGVTQTLLKNLRAERTRSISKLRGLGIEYS